MSTLESSPTTRRIVPRNRASNIEIYGRVLPAGRIRNANMPRNLK